MDQEGRRFFKKFWELVKQYKKPLIILTVTFSIILWAPTIYANLSTKSQRYDLGKVDIKQIPERKVAIVFGAGILENRKPTPYLEWRVKTAVKLYEAGRVHALLMSGDNSTKRHNEPVVMKELAVSLGVPARDIKLDYAGFSTYDSCYRAKAIFNIKEATLVTQGYHLPRAVMTCNNLGINSIGVSALRGGRDFTPTYIMREWISTDKAIGQLIFKPKPTVLGKPEQI